MPNASSKGKEKNIKKAIEMLTKAKKKTVTQQFYRKCSIAPMKINVLNLMEK